MTGLVGVAIDAAIAVAIVAAIGVAIVAVGIGDEEMND